VLATNGFQAIFSLAASACSSQYVIPISRYIAVAVVRCSCACSRLPPRATIAPAAAVHMKLRDGD
jgi:hypothetical protein